MYISTLAIILLFHWPIHSTDQCGAWQWLGLWTTFMIAFD